MITGKLPTMVSERLRGVPLMPLKQLAPNTPDAVAQAVERGLAIHHEARFASAREFRKALGLVAATDSLETSNTKSKTNSRIRNDKKMQFWLYGRRGLFAGQCRPLPVGREITLGRGPGNDISLPNEIKGVSRKQCVLYMAPDNKLYVRDAGSRYGTILNGNRIKMDWEFVSSGSRIIVGAEEFELVLRPAPGQ